MRAQIEAVIRDLLSPLFSSEGGTVELIDVQEQLVRLRFGGAYRGDPSVSYMVSAFVTPAFKQAVGSDVRVEVVA